MTLIAILGAILQLAPQGFQLFQLVESVVDKSPTPTPTDQFISDGLAQLLPLIQKGINIAPIAQNLYDMALAQSNEARAPTPEENSSLDAIVKQADVYFDAAVAAKGVSTA